MHSAALASILSYHALFLLYAQTHTQPRTPRGAGHVLTLTALSAVCAVMQMYATPWLGTLLAAAVMAKGLVRPVGMSGAQALFAAVFCVLNLQLFFRALDRADALLATIGAPVPHALAALLAVPCALALLILLRKTLFPDSDVRHFLSSGPEVGRAAIYAAAATGLLTALCAGVQPWALWATAVAYGGMILALCRSIQRVWQSDYQGRIRLLEEQCQRQQRQETVWQSRIRSISALEHDLKPTMGVLKALIETDDHERALRLIDDLCTDLQSRTPPDRAYSNDAVLDALLGEVAATCRARQIRFSAQVSLPENAGLSPLDSIRLVSNITGNAVQACLKLPEAERFISLSCQYERSWVTFEAVNSYDGTLREEDGKLLTTKAGGGMGLSILGEITERLGGFWFYHADTAKKTFLIRVHIPREAPEHTAGGRQAS